MAGQIRLCLLAQWPLCAIPAQHERRQPMSQHPGGRASSRSRAQTDDPGRTRTCNPRLRSPMPYPLGHGANGRPITPAHKSLIPARRDTSAIRDAVTPSVRTRRRSTEARREAGAHVGREEQGALHARMRRHGRDEPPSSRCRSPHIHTQARRHVHTSTRAHTRTVCRSAAGLRTWERRRHHQTNNGLLFDSKSIVAEDEL